MKWLHQCFGVSKQAFYKRLKAYKKQQSHHEMLIHFVKNERKDKGNKLGGRKLHHILKDQMESLDIKMGRDKFFSFLRMNNLLIPKTKNYHITTNSRHRFFKYPNIVKDKVPNRPEQLWVSDITYIKTDYGHNYLALVTDAYSKRIMGYKLASHMKASLCLDALKMAIKNREYPNEKLIHHSDRGFQYCSDEYTSFAKQNNINLSMTEQYDPYENAVAERINRTLKHEYGMKLKIKNTTLAKKMVNKAVETYNNKRPHLSLNFDTPNNFHKQRIKKYKSYKKDISNINELTF